LLRAGKLELAEACLDKAGDLSGLLLMNAARGNPGAMAQLAERATEAGKQNVAFLALFLLGQVRAPPRSPRGRGQ
jgi:coatomer subunit beta'